MKRFLTALSITSTFVLIQACASQVKSGETPNSNGSAVSNTNPHAGHNMGNSQTPKAEENSHDEHSGHSNLEPGNATAKLTVADKIIPNTPVPIVIEVQENNGKVIASFDQFQEKLMHLIVVSDDLQSFNHIHPIYKGNGRFEVQANFPHPGRYSLFSDYKVAGKAEQVSVLKAEVPGNYPTAPKIDLATTKIFGNTKANLKLSQPTIEARKEVNLIFDLQDTVSNQPLKDLKSYLGERGHLVILKQLSPLTQGDYIHAHAMKNTPAAEIHFITSFPKPGKYKMWGQFNRNGKIIIADFWVNVQ